MAGFSVDILATLKTSEIDKQIKEIGGKQITFTNFNVDSLISQIDEKLKGHKFKIDFDGLKSAASSLNGITNNFSKDIQSGFKQIDVSATNTADRISKISAELSSIGASENQVKAAENTIKGLGKAVKQVSASLSKGVLSLHITGVDGAKDALNIIEQFDDAGKSLANRKGIELKFDTGEAAAKQAEKNYKAYLKTIKAIGSVQSDIDRATANKDTAGLNVATERRHNLIQKALTQKKALGNNLPSDWQEEINGEWAKTRYASAKSKAKSETAALQKAETEAAQSQKKNYGELLQTIDKIGKEKAALAKMDLNDPYLGNQQKNIEELYKQAAKLRKTLGKDISDDMASEIGTHWKESNKVADKAVSDKGFSTFKSAQKESLKDQQSDYKKLIALRKELQKAEVDSHKAEISGKDNKKLESKREIVNSLKKDYEDLYKEIGSGLNEKQKEKLDLFDDSTKKSLKNIDDGAIDKLTNKLNKAKDAFKDTKGSTSLFSGVSDSLEELDKLQEKMKSPELTSDEYSNFATQFVEKLKLANQELEEAKTNAAALQKAVEATSGGKASDLTAKIDPIKRAYKNLGGDDNSNLSQIRGEIATIETLQSKLSNIDIDVNPTEAISTWKDLESHLHNVNNLLKSAKANTDAVPVEKVAKLKSKLENWLKKNPKAENAYGGQIRQLIADLEKLDRFADGAQANFKKIEDGLEGIDKAAEANGKKGTTFWGDLKGAFKSISKYVSASEVIYKGIETVKEMYQNVVEIDSAMTSLKKVTDETDATYDAFLSRASDNAVKLGRTVSSLVEQTATWSKLGFNISDSESLSQISAIYANVGEVSDETAVSDMVTAMKAFNIEANDAITIVDALNALGNNFATDAASLGEGLSRSASSMATAGSDLNSTLALITGISEITQDSAEAGTFLKVSSMRLRGMKGQLEELNEEVDESVDSISKVQTQILNLTHGKVNIFDDKGEFRDYYQIMKEIAEVFSELSSIEQASLSEVLFGKQRGNQGAALIQAFQSGQIQKAYETAVNSSGSAMEEQERWMDSIQAKSQQLEAQFQALSQAFLNSELVKGTFDAGTGILGFLTNVIEGIGTAGTVAAGAGIYKTIKSLA